MEVSHIAPWEEICILLLYQMEQSFRSLRSQLYVNRYQSAQLELWQPGEVEWFVISATLQVNRRKRKGHIFVWQLPLLLDGTEG